MVATSNPDEPSFSDPKKKMVDLVRYIEKGYLLSKVSGLVMRNPSIGP